LLLGSVFQVLQDFSLLKVSLIDDPGPVRGFMVRAGIWSFFFNPLAVSAMIVVLPLDGAGLFLLFCSSLWFCAISFCFPYEAVH